MTNEKSGFGILKKGSKICLLLGKDCIKSPAVLAISASYSGCYLVGIYWKNTMGKIIALCRQKFGKFTSFKIPMSPLSSSYLSVFTAECTEESWSCSLCYLSLLSKVHLLHMHSKIPQCHLGWSLEPNWLLHKIHLLPQVFWPVSM